MKFNEIYDELGDSLHYHGPIGGSQWVQCLCFLGGVQGIRTLPLWRSRRPNTLAPHAIISTSRKILRPLASTRALLRKRRDRGKPSPAALSFQLVATNSTSKQCTNPRNSNSRATKQISSIFFFLLISSSSFS